MQNPQPEIGTRGSASKRRGSSSHGMAIASNEEYIQQLRAEIERLKSESGHGSNHTRHQW